MNVVLMGFMGTGKTAVGRRLAERLGYRLVDMDEIIERREGRSIAEIFADDGEKYFRRVEREVVRELANRDGLVVSTGGGVVLDPRNVDDLAASGVAVCLNASPETILERVEEEGHRPLLEQGRKAERIRSILEARREHYARVPHQIETDHLTVEEVVDAIMQIEAIQNKLDMGFTKICKSNTFRRL